MRTSPRKQRSTIFASDSGNLLIPTRHSPFIESERNLPDKSSPVRSLPGPKSGGNEFFHCGPR